MEIYRRKNFRFSEWAPGSGTPESRNSHIGDKLLRDLQGALQCSNENLGQIQTVWNIVETLSTEIQEPRTGIPVGGALIRDYKDTKSFLIDGLLYHRERHTSSLTVIDRDHTSLILQECHGSPIWDT
ncbi:hypothetical protein O181_066040 [Austropuccinia psidii MF-1]|uniref:Uncharacterized protein n=1 Tax=Austropuccinia psidii MF-1 TaxID=1389203 RepID=A0A9Q3EWA8_9BASI|nr:hypothetical protein [Austropuccinia psidii MF-1]